MKCIIYFRVHIITHHLARGRGICYYDIQRAIVQIAALSFRLKQEGSRANCFVRHRVAFATSITDNVIVSCGRVMFNYYNFRD